jgi:sec-independent protein translocase protein TatC
MKFYFLEIKNRFILVLILQVSTFLSLYSYKEAVLFLAISPIVNLDYPSRNFIFTGVTEPLTAYLILTYFVNVQLTLVFTFYQLVFFLASGLYGIELKRVFQFIKLSSFLLVSSCMLANLLLIPWSWLFFFDFYKNNYGAALGTHLEFKLLEYLEFYTSFHWIILAYFQLTALLLLFVSSRRLTIGRIRESRKVLFFAFFLLSALVCPDIFSFITFVVCLLGSYEFYVVVKLLRFG